MCQAKTLRKRQDSTAAVTIKDEFKFKTKLPAPSPFLSMRMHSPKKLGIAVNEDAQCFQRATLFMTPKRSSTFDSSPPPLNKPFLLFNDEAFELPIPAKLLLPDTY
jgi:hypothetical protein